MSPAYRTRAGRTNLVRLHIAQPFTEARQAVDGALACVGRNIAFFRESLGQAHRFANAIENRKLAMAQLAYDHVETVRAEIYGRDNFWLGGLRR